MIKEFEKYHGAVLTRLIHDSKISIKIETYLSKSNSSYVINNKIGLYIKHSKSRLSPWNFSFLREHQDEISEMKNKFENVFIVFVCHDDGIVALSFKELKNILDEEHEETEWVSIKRRPREKYTISGHDGGKMKFKIGENEFPEKLFVNSNNSNDLIEVKRKSRLSFFGINFNSNRIKN